MKFNDTTLHELSVNETTAIQGGDTLSKTMEYSLALAVAGGVFAMPVLVGVSFLMAEPCSPSTAYSSGKPCTSRTRTT